jgi:hypothetical protein
MLTALPLACLLAFSVAAADASPAAAAPNETTAPSRPEWQSAIAAYQALDYEGALVAFSQVDAAPLDDAERATLRLWVALCQAGIGDFAAAQSTMRDALALHRDAVLPTTVSPRVVDLFTAEQQALAPKTPPTPATPAPRTPLSALGFAGIGATGAGVVALAVGGVLTGVAFYQLAVVDDPDTFQSDAQAALNVANAAAAVAIVAGVVGVVLGGAGVGVIAYDLQDD